MKKNTIVIIGGGSSFKSKSEFLESLKKERVSIFEDYSGWMQNFYRDLKDRFEVIIPSMPSFNVIRKNKFNLPDIEIKKIGI